LLLAAVICKTKVLVVKIVWVGFERAALVT
jgi:hypothetical protein